MSDLMFHTPPYPEPDVSLLLTLATVGDLSIVVNWQNPYMRGETRFTRIQVHVRSEDLERWRVYRNGMLEPESPWGVLDSRQYAEQAMEMWGEQARMSDQLIADMGGHEEGVRLKVRRTRLQRHVDSLSKLEDIGGVPQSEKTKMMTAWIAELKRLVG